MDPVLLDVEPASTFAEVFLKQYGLWSVGYLLAAYFVFQNGKLQGTVQQLLREAVTAQQQMTAALQTLADWVKEHSK